MTAASTLRVNVSVRDESGHPDESAVRVTVCVELDGVVLVELTALADEEHEPKEDPAIEGMLDQVREEVKNMVWTAFEGSL